MWLIIITEITLGNNNDSINANPLLLLLLLLAVTLFSVVILEVVILFQMIKITTPAVYVNELQRKSINQSIMVRI